MGRYVSLLTTRNSIIKYRADIDGLRAFAVLSVVFYHFDIGPFSGGFVGVDVFFVISGYLITKVINGQIESGIFSFRDFYERRARRILPALFALLLTSFIAGTFLLLPSDQRILSSTLLSTLLFASNIFFWRHTGYFEPSAEYNPLLHTWSLAVEEQFYIFFPIALLIIARLRRTALIPALSIVAVVSFVLCLHWQSRHSIAVFYLAPFRAWELMIGSLLAVRAIRLPESSRLRLGLATTALAVLFGSSLWTEAGRNFPGWQAVFPVLATAALILSGESGGTPLHRLLSCRPLVSIGLISYSLYLWHWPLIVLVKYHNGPSPLSATAKWILVIASIIVSWVSYKWIESPFRRRRHSSIKTSRAPAFGVAVMGAVFIAAGLLAANVGAKPDKRFSHEVRQFDRARRPVIPFLECDGKDPALAAGDCTIGPRRAEPTFILWGDSHALAWAPAFAKLADDTSKEGVLAIKSACPPLVGVITRRVGDACGTFNRGVLRFIDNVHPKRVYLVASWPDYSDDDGLYRLADNLGRVGNEIIFPSALAETIGRLERSAGQVVLVGPTPGAPAEIPFQLAIAQLHNRPWPAPVTSATFADRSEEFWLSARRLRGPGLTIIDPSPWFCREGACRYSVGDILLYRDDGHLSVAGAEFVTRTLAATLRESARR